MSDRQRQPPGGGAGGGGRRRRRRLRERRRADGQPQQPSREDQNTQKKKGDRGGRGTRRDKRREGGRPARERQPRLEYTSVISLPEDKAAACALCGKPVRDAVAALCHGEDRLPAHFDCVVENLRAQKELGNDERICYLGGGHFGVVRYAQGEGKAPFTIRDRLQYESGGEERPDWRRVLDAIASRKKAEPKPEPAPKDPPAQS